MTAEQFKAAGLDKLSPEELANLNTWLDRTITTETAKAAEQASVQTKERVESENRGFFHFGSDDPIESRITGTFAGFRSEEHTSELQSLMRISYAVFCLKKKK